MSLPWATRGLKIPCVDCNDRKSRSLAMASALSCDKKPRNLPRETTSKRPFLLVHVNPRGTQSHQKDHICLFMTWLTA
jgi:hypothetical protein